MLSVSYEGHLDRLARVAFHPSGAYIGTASFDKTWRLWDVNTGIELLLQEGHSRSVYGIAFQQDGALAASCGMDALARVWDLRTGKSILALEGHVKPVSIFTSLVLIRYAQAILAWHCFCAPLTEVFL
jgi:U4/U6 small nuclear ribonucleoprotein PRP4